jgi:F0F1-type ATP synthase assembly protein I
MFDLGMADNDGGSSEEDRDVARKRDELLAQARGGKGIGFTGKGADPRLMGLGLQFVVAILLSLYAGMWLDAKLRTAPWCMLIGAVLGASAGFYSMFRVLMSEDKRMDEEDKRKR